MNKIKLQTEDLKPETVLKLKKIYTDFPELIEYHIKFGNVYEKAQATIIKGVALSDCKCHNIGSCTCNSLLGDHFYKFESDSNE